MQQSFIFRENGSPPECHQQYWEGDFLNGVVFRWFSNRPHLAYGEKMTCYSMEAAIHKLLDCRTHFYNIFIYEVNKIICDINIEKGSIYVDELAIPLVRNIREKITLELYVPPEFLKLEVLTNDWIEMRSDSNSDN